MSGIYVHIPFCRKVCFYCDFHFTVSLKNKDTLINSICEEIKLRNDYLKDLTFDTIYFGGGTPSVLTIDDIKKIFNALYKNFSIIKDAEITMEVNPDDLNQEYTAALKNRTPINRLSIGVQSFIDEYLIWLNRRHKAKDAEECIKIAKSEGFENINVDLLYGIPQMTEDQWKKNLEKIINLNVQHISAYHLTIEPDTVFERRLKKGFIREIDEQLSYNQFKVLLKKLRSNGFDHYEISNFAKEKFFSAHNLNYWKFGKYIGLGPSAHSFDGKSRQWNVKINSQYIKEINRRGAYYERENLNENNLFNEYIMVSLRTKWGIDLQSVKERFGEKRQKYLLEVVTKFILSDHIFKKENNLILTDKGKFISDYITSELFYNTTSNAK